MSRQQLFLEPADSEQPAAQGDLASHGDAGLDRDAGRHRHQCRAHADAGAGTVLGRGPFGHMHMQIVLLMKVPWHAEGFAAAADEGQRRLNALLHDVAQGTGASLAPFAGHSHSFYVEQLAARFRPRQARGDADPALLLGQSIGEFAHPVVALQIRRPDGGAIAIAAHDLLPHHLAGELGQLPFQAAHSRLAGVVADQVDQGIVVNR